MSGGGFTFNGLVAAAGTDLVGNYSGPGGSAGGFAMLNTVTGAVTTFCGTFTGAGGGRLVMSISTGAWSLVVGSIRRTAQMVSSEDSDRETA